jgi:hypothetical protein
MLGCRETGAHHSTSQASALTWRECGGCYRRCTSRDAITANRAHLRRGRDRGRVERRPASACSDRAGRTSAVRPVADVMRVGGRDGDLHRRSRARSQYRSRDYEAHIATRVTG